MSTYDKDYYANLMAKGSQTIFQVTPRQSKRKITLLYVCEMLLYGEGHKLLLVGQDHHFPTDVMALLGEEVKRNKNGFRNTILTYGENSIKFVSSKDYKDHVSFIRGEIFTKEILNNKTDSVPQHPHTQRIIIRDLEYHIKHQLSNVEEDVLLNMANDKKSFSNGGNLSIFLGLLRYYLFDDKISNVKVYMKTNSEEGLDLKGYLENSIPHSGFKVNYGVKTTKTSICSYDIKMDGDFKSVDEYSTLPYTLDGTNTNLVLIAGEPTVEDLSSIQRYLNGKSNAKIFTLSKTFLDDIPSDVFLYEIP